MRGPTCEWCWICIFKYQARRHGFVPMTAPWLVNGSRGRFGSISSRPRCYWEQLVECSALQKRSDWRRYAPWLISLLSWTSWYINRRQKTISTTCVTNWASRPAWMQVDHQRFFRHVSPPLGINLSYCQDGLAWTFHGGDALWSHIASSDVVPPEDSTIGLAPDQSPACCCFRKLETVYEQTQ